MTRRYFGIMLLGTAALLLALSASPAGAQKAIADYDHADPAVRTEFVTIFGDWPIRMDKERYIDVAADLIPHWQRPEQAKDLRLLCRDLFGMLNSARLLDKYLDLTIGCPQDQRDLMSGKVDREPIPTSFIAPVFSRGDMKSGVRAELLVSFAISAEGDPKNVQIVRSSYGRINRSIRRAAQKARFLPAIQNQQPVQIPIYYVKYEVVFEKPDGVSTVIRAIGPSLDEEVDDGCEFAPWDEGGKACD